MTPFTPSNAISHTPRALRARTTLPLADQRGQRIAVLDGQVWITLQNDARDVVLEPGECFVIDRPGLTLVFALRDAILTVSPPAAGETCQTC
jgi:Protein of unknown function (DUF2917)